MSVKIDSLLQDGKLLVEAVDGKREQMAAKGFTDEKYDKLTGAFDDLRVKELEQQKAVKALENMTAGQNREVAHVGELIQKVRNAVRSAYGKDKQNLKLFKVDVKIPTSVKSLCTLTEYMISITADEEELLLKNGLTRADIDDLNASYGRLVAADARQEKAKKLQMAATVARDKAAKTFNEKIYKTRSFAKACFAGDKESLLLFKPLPKGRGGTKGGGGDEGSQNQ
jgi:hypothetical protein